MSRPHRQPPPADQQTVRRHNLGLIARAVSSAPGSRTRLAQRTGLTKATVSSLVDSLLLQGILVEGDAAPARVGRPARPVGLNPEGPAALGLEANVDYLAAGLLDLTGAARAHRRVEVDNRRRPPEAILDDLAALCRELAPAGRPLLGIALAVPGVVGRDGRPVRVPNLPELAGQPLAAQLADRLPARLRLLDPVVLLDNEANLGALSWLRRAGGDRDFVYVSGEIGIGAGLVVDGALFRGAGGFAGELGHVVVERDGPPCRCGGRGCLEQYAGQDVLLAASGQRDLVALAAAGAAGEPAALAALAAAGSALGVGLASLLNVLDLPLVVLGSGYAQLYELIVPALRAELDLRVLSGPGVRLARSTLGTDAAVLGAAGAVLERALGDPGALLDPADPGPPATAP
ncbi:MAG TPA: ROK family protein [Jatrophihabitans sp.]|nr:ROK family protein [Jatrophihabitans sp.]